MDDGEKSADDSLHTGAGGFELHPAVSADADAEADIESEVVDTCCCRLLVRRACGQGSYHFPELVQTPGVCEGETLSRAKQ